MKSNIIIETEILQSLKGEVVTCDGVTDYLFYLHFSGSDRWTVYNTSFHVSDIEKIVIEKDSIEIFLKG